MRTAARPAKRLALGPKDAGRRFTWEDFAAADWREGFRYELIDGRLVVSPAPEIDHDDMCNWLEEALRRYRRRRPDVIARISSRARVFVPDRPDATVPEPDLAVYREFAAPAERSPDFAWSDVSPMLVVEVLSPENVEKDLFRNVTLYELVPSIQEYWIIDPLDGPEAATLIVHRRRGRKWQKPITVNLGRGDEYTTKLLPDFRLRLDPMA